MKILGRMPTLASVINGFISTYIRPAYVFITLSSMFILLGVVVWLPNLQLLQAVFTSDALAMTEKLQFMLDMYKVIFRLHGMLQTALLLFITLSSGLYLALLIRIARHVHASSKVYTKRLRFAILTSAVGSGIGLIGATLMSPTISNEGVIVHVGSHIAGTLVTGFGAVVVARGCWYLLGYLADQK